MRIFSLSLVLFALLSASLLRAQSDPGAKATPVAPQALPASASAEPQQPKTEIFDSSATASGALSTDGHDPILDPPPIPEGVTTVVGGSLTSVDHIRNKLTLAIFGGGHWRISFDERTHIFRKGTETTQLALKPGERVYVDTMLDGINHKVFARSIRLESGGSPADAAGLVLDIDSDRERITLNDRMSSTPVQFSMNGETRILRDGAKASVDDIQKGSLVHVVFSPDRSNRGLAREIDILARPGTSFIFAGKITFLDLHRGVVALQNATDDKNYELHFDPAKMPEKSKLGVGVQVRIDASFESTEYTARSITVVSESPGQTPRPAPDKP
ncbi:MAG TPA: hypothetical protein VKZ53_27210 [Candidatus Angelobacter sp.]|nr:hypothetical protein [Candidatus Angelobacter sp.]